MHFIILAFTFLFIWQEARLKKVKVSDSITMSVPVDFLLMPEQDIAARHHSYRKPIALFTNQERDISLSINTAVSQWPESDLALMKNFYKASINSLFDQVDFISDEIKEVEGRKFAVLEFISVTEPEEASRQVQTTLRNYTLAQYAIVNGKTMVFTFTAPERKKENWQPVARQIMGSIKIK